MNRFLLLTCVILLAAGCSQQQPPGMRLSSQDSILTRPQLHAVDTVRPTADTNGLLVDPLISQQPAAERAAIARFTPKQVLEIYEDYRPLRNSQLVSDSLQHFLDRHSLTRPELRAILGEGDRLGWADAK